MLATCHNGSILPLILETGGSGLGLIIAQTLESNGAKVYITGRNGERLQEAVKTAVRHTAQLSLYDATFNSKIGTR